MYVKVWSDKLQTYFAKENILSLNNHLTFSLALKKLMHSMKNCPKDLSSLQWSFSFFSFCIFLQWSLLCLEQENILTRVGGHSVCAVVNQLQAGLLYHLQNVTYDQVIFNHNPNILFLLFLKTSEYCS